MTQFSKVDEARERLADEDGRYRLSRAELQEWFDTFVDQQGEAGHPQHECLLAVRDILDALPKASGDREAVAAEVLDHFSYIRETMRLTKIVEEIANEAIRNYNLDRTDFRPERYADAILNLRIGEGE